MSQQLELNYCPRCGHDLADRQAFGRMRRVCSACGLVVFRDLKVAAGVLVVQAGKVLLVRRRWGPALGTWSIPAGFVEFDEDPAEAAVRECYEETGLQVQVTGLLDVISGREHERGANIVIVYSAWPVAGKLQADDDVDDAAFFAPDDLPTLSFRATERAIEHWIRARVG